MSRGVAHTSLLLCPLTHTPLPRCARKAFLCLCLYSCPANRFICTIFLDSTYMCSRRMLVFLFLTYSTLYDRQEFEFYFKSKGRHWRNSHWVLKKRANSSGFYGGNDLKGGHLRKQGTLHLPRGERTGALEKTHAELLARK